MSEQNKIPSDFELASVNSDVLSRPQTGPFTVGSLVRALEQVFIPEDAEAWDRTGLVVGDYRQEVSKVAVALDPTADAVKIAAARGCNVLITHHPPYIESPDSFAPQGSGACGSQLAVWQAISDGVALACFHTALDVSAQAQRVLPSMLGLDFVRVLHTLGHDDTKGYGQYCRVSQADGSLTLEQLAARCVAVFGRMPRVWGPPELKLESIVTATGSGGSLVQDCLDANVSCLVCGEVHYHDCVHAAEAELSLIELGHDVSELPLCAVIAAALGQVGISESEIVLIDQSANWWTPEATRR